MVLGLDRAGRGGVLVLSRDADDGRGVRRTICWRCGTHLGAERGAGDRGRLRDGVHRVAAGRQAVPGVRPAVRASRRSRGIGSSLGVVAARGRRRRLVVDAHAVAAPQLHRRLLRHGAAVHQRRRVRLDLPRRRRLDDAVLRSGCSGRRIPGLGHRDDGAGDRAGRRDRDQRDRQAAAAARRELLLRVPVFRTIYAPVKQLVVAFSPDNESGSSGWC